MKNDILLDFIWIPSDLGGHSAMPYTGMRLSIRWQRYLYEYLQCAHDVECRLLSYDDVTSKGKIACSLSSKESIPSEWFQDGQLIELLNGFRVLAIGVIRS